MKTVAAYIPGQGLYAVGIVVFLQNRPDLWGGSEALGEADEVAGRRGQAPDAVDKPLDVGDGLKGYEHPLPPQVASLEPLDGLLALHEPIDGKKWLAQPPPQQTAAQGRPGAALP